MEDIKAIAKAQAEEKGHKLTRFRPLKINKVKSEQAECYTCHLHVTVNAIAISGPAVTQICARGYRPKFGSISPDFQRIKNLQAVLDSKLKIGEWLDLFEVSNACLVYHNQHVDVIIRGTKLVQMPAISGPELRLLLNRRPTLKIIQYGRSYYCAPKANAMPDGFYTKLLRSYGTENQQKIIAEC